jgi:hypothetical protein
MMSQLLANLGLNPLVGRPRTLKSLLGEAVKSREVMRDNHEL